MRSSLLFLMLLMAGPAALAQNRDLVEKSQRGKAALEAGHFAEAETIYAELVRALPDNPGMLVNLGLAQFSAGRPDQAVEQFRTAVRIQPDLLPGWLLMGAALLETGHLDQAVEPLQRVVSLDPSNRDALGMLSETLILLGRYTEATAPLRRLSELDPRNPRAWFGLGRTYEVLSQQAFTGLQEADSDSAYWLALVGDSLFRQGKHSNAFYFYRQALEKRADLRGVHASLAEVYRATGHSDWAQREEEKERQLPAPDCVLKPVECDFQAGRYHQVILSDTGRGDPETLYWRVRAANRLALEAFSKLGELPPSAPMHQLRAEIAMSQDRFLEAVDELQKALQMEPENREIEHRLAEALHRSRRHEQAQQLLRKLLQDEPAAPDLNFLYGDSLLLTQQIEPAIPFLQRAAETDPSLLAAHAALGRAFLQLGRDEEALPYLRLALPIDDDGSLHYQLARVLRVVGQPEEAQEVLSRYQEIQQTNEAEKAQLEAEIRITPP